MLQFDFGPSEFNPHELQNFKREFKRLPGGVPTSPLLLIRAESPDPLALADAREYARSVRADAWTYRRYTLSSKVYLWEAVAAGHWLDPGRLDLHLHRPERWLVLHEAAHLLGRCSLIGRYVADLQELAGASDGSSASRSARLDNPVVLRDYFQSLDPYGWWREFADMAELPSPLPRLSNRWLDLIDDAMELFIPRRYGGDLLDNEEPDLAAWAAARLLSEEDARILVRIVRPEGYAAGGRPSRDRLARRAAWRARKGLAATGATPAASKRSPAQPL